LFPEARTPDAPVRVAACQYPVQFLGKWSRFESKLRGLLGEAAERRAQLVVFPEYASMELASLFSQEVYGHLHRQLDAMQDLLGDYRALHRSLAMEHGLYLLAGSFPVRVSDGSYRNRTYLYSPDGGEGFQDKLHMTRFEQEHWHIDPGHEVKVFNTQLGALAVATCYDVEFPQVVRKQVEAGAWLVLVPSCTDREAGYQRVRIGCQARAMENQVYVVQSPTVGEAPWSESIDSNVGLGTVYTPVDIGFPENGILVQGRRGDTGWVYADLDPRAITRVRHKGQVFNHRDWIRHRQASDLATEHVTI
jgi:predicted amidohydrolase